MIKQFIVTSIDMSIDAWRNCNFTTNQISCTSVRRMAERNHTSRKAISVKRSQRRVMFHQMIGMRCLMDMKRVKRLCSKPRVFFQGTNPLFICCGNNNKKNLEHSPNVSVIMERRIRRPRPATAMPSTVLRLPLPRPLRWK